MKNRFLFLLSLALFVLNNPGFCQSADSSLEDPDTLTVSKRPNPPVQELSPLEVRAIRASDVAPFAKTDISGATLQKDNLGQDLPILLQYTPSVVVTSDAGAGVGYTGIRIRGSDATRINTTLNGIAVNDAESSGTYFVDLPDLASSTSSLQIQRGVGTSTNGAGAFGGTLSIANLDIPDQAHAAIGISYGSFNTQKYTLSAGTGLISNQIALDFRVSHVTSDGYIDRASSNLNALQVGVLWKAGKKTTIKAMVLMGTETTYQAWNGVPGEKLYGPDSALAAHYANNVGSLYYTTKDSQNLFGSNPRTYNYFTYNNQTDNYKQNYYQVFVDHIFHPNLSAHLGLFLTRGIGYYEEYKPQQNFSAYGLPDFNPGPGDTIHTTDLIRRLWLDNYNYGAVYSLLWTPAKGTHLNFGGGWSQYTGSHYGNVVWAQYGVPENYEWYKVDAQKNDFNLYAKWEQQLYTNLWLYTDLQFRNIGYFMNGFEANPDLKPAVNYNFFNPKLGINYSFRNTATLREKLYASIAIAHKEPNRDDFEASLNDLPKPERLTDLEAGYELNRSGLNLSLNGFFMNYKDQLVLTGKINDVGAYTRTNVPQSYRAGLEAQAGYKVNEWLSLGANATYSQNKIKAFTEYIDNYDDNTQKTIQHEHTDIAFSPDWIAAGSIQLKPFRYSKPLKALELEFLGKYVGMQYLDNTSDAGRSLKDYGLCDIRIRYHFVTKVFREIGFSLLLNNVLNKQYESNGYTYSYIYAAALNTQNFYFPQAGFNWLLGVNVKW